ncbi:MAG: hypothetical protein JXI32_06535 [Deltaproteobacteria bacterium]|nr:hypothetical protein [Deltaproteobacteria bacterium]
MNFKNLTDNEVNALAPHTFKYSIPIMQYYGRDKSSVGSGTLIKIGSRFLIATAGHNLVGVPDDCLYYVPSKKMIYDQPPFIRRNPLANSSDPGEADVGYIEIPSEIAISIEEREFLPLNRIRPFIVTWPTRVFLTGFPAEMVPIELATKNKFILSAIGYLTEIRKPNQQRDDSMDIIVDYEPTSVLVERPNGWKMPNPRGISGGGLWALPLAGRTELWNPDDTTLIGIEKSWLETSNCVRCTQIQHWLKLVANDFPDLAEIIDEHLQSRENCHDLFGG